MDPFAMPQFGAMPSSSFTMPAPKPSGGMFGGGSNIGMAISAALNGYLAAGGNPAGIAGLQQLHQQRLYAQQQAAEDAKRQQQNQDSRDNFVFEQQYRADHPDTQPDDMTRHMLAAGIDPNSEQGKAFYRNSLDPVVMTAQGPMLRSQLLGAGQPAPQGVTFTPIDGGPTPQASGGFPY